MLPIVVTLLPLSGSSLRKVEALEGPEDLALDGVCEVLPAHRGAVAVIAGPACGVLLGRSKVMIATA